MVSIVEKTRRLLTDADKNRTYSDMADEYLDILELKVDKSDQIAEEISHQETPLFRFWMFKKHNFPSKAWTLWSNLRVLKDYICRFVLYITLLLTCSAAQAAECKIPYTGKVPGLEYNLSAAECQTIYYGGQLVTMRVRYPDAHVVADEIKKENILFYFIYYNKRTDLWAPFKGEYPVRFVGDISVYGSSNNENFVFKGMDNEDVFVTRMGRTWMAKRMFKGVYTKYQFNAEEYSDFKAMDKFALRFLQHVIVN